MKRIACISIIVIGLLLTVNNGSALAEEARADVSLPALENTAHQRMTQLAKDDPLSFLDTALNEYHNWIKDYTCTFEKQEFLKGKMTKEQVINVKFKEGPFSVFMEWEKNPSLVARVLYVKGQNDNKALVKPAGILGWLVPTHVKRRVDSPDARKASRRNLDQFGFANALRLITKVCRKAEKAGDLQLQYKGTSDLTGRPTWVFERRLPKESIYPDQRLIVHIDQEWLVPTRTCCYDDRGNLLGKYVYRDVKFNVGLSGKDFTAKSNGL